MYSEHGNNVWVSFSLPTAAPPLKQNRGEVTLGFFTKASIVNLLYEETIFTTRTDRTRKGTFLIPYTSLHNITTAFQ